MFGRSYTPQEDARLREAYPLGRLTDLARELNRSLPAVKCRAKVLGLRRTRSNYRPWQPTELKILRELFPGTPTPQICEILGRTATTIYQKADHLGIKKSEAYLASPAACRLRRGDNIGAAFRFPRGHVPANKGLRRPGWSPGRMSDTQFKKGCRVGAANRNWRPIGTVMPDTDGYLRRKIAEGKGGFGNQKAWEFVHRRVWEDVKGPIPDGRAVIFRDGNKTNVAFENLELLTRAEMMKRNTIHRLPEELKSLIRLAGKLRRKIGEREDAEQQNYGPAKPSFRNARRSRGR